jgi:hypothetical protein
MQLCISAHETTLWGMTRIIVESDCQVLVNALSKEYDRSAVCVLVRDAKMLARLNFNSVSFVFGCKTCNKAAHAMAALGASGSFGSGLLCQIMCRIM